MKDKLGYTPLVVVLARILIEHIDAPNTAQNPGTVDCSILGSWLATNKLMTQAEVQRLDFSKLDLDNGHYASIARIMYELVFHPQYKSSNKIVRDLMCVGLFLDASGIMTEAESKKFVEGLADRLADRVREETGHDIKTAFDGDIVLKVEE